MSVVRHAVLGERFVTVVRRAGRNDLLDVVREVLARVVQVVADRSECVALALLQRAALLDPAFVIQQFELERTVPQVRVRCLLRAQHRAAFRSVCVAPGRRREAVISVVLHAQYTVIKGNSNNYRLGMTVVCHAILGKRSVAIVRRTARNDFLDVVREILARSAVQIAQFICEFSECRGLTSTHRFRLDMLVVGVQQLELERAVAQGCVRSLLRAQLCSDFCCNFICKYSFNNI